jgi:hypothetical protein
MILADCSAVLRSDAMGMIWANYQIVEEEEQEVKA